MTATPTAAPTAREVVADYLRAKVDNDRPAHQRKTAAMYTRAVVDELPDGFTVKDVRVCVGVLAETDPDLDGFSAQRRTRIITQVLNEGVADGWLTLDGDEYAHTGS